MRANERLPKVSRSTRLVPVKLVPHYRQPPRAQQVPLHQLGGCLGVGPQTDAEERQVAAQGEKVPALEEAGRLYGPRDRQACLARLVAGGVAW